MRNTLITLLSVIFMASCSLDNKKGGTFTYKIIENKTNKDLTIKAYDENIIIDSFYISPFSIKQDTAYDGNGKQESFAPQYIYADSVVVIFNNQLFINYTVFFNPNPNYNLINNKNLLGEGWEELENYTEKKTTYITSSFSITEQDDLLADTL